MEVYSDYVKNYNQAIEVFNKSLEISTFSHFLEV